ncbi:RloB family protein [Flavobacterium daejeonense]|uniref:RloB family protein n=1 Tax=Flavobacterium daejeonense TaxID=350893 RepID=UPI00068E43F9|nr:RloB family protein [Flavobacterium daejeonense]
MKMKNKKSIEELSREKHRKQLQEAKRRKKEEPIVERTFNIRDEKPKLLITCEGKNTEKDYFCKFKISSLELKVVGLGDNTLSLVNKTIALRDQKEPGYYEEVWCVFDADPKPDNPNQLMNFDQAIFLANKNNIKVAYSHQAFEYWLLLHFNDYQGEPMNRNLYKKALNKFLKPFGLKYDDNSDKRGKSISNAFFDVLLSCENGKRRICHAIERAERIFNKLESHKNPAINESSTTVFLLVKRILGIDKDNPCTEIKF